MHPAWMTAWRPARYCIQGNKITIDLVGFRNVFSTIAKPQGRSIRGTDSSLPRAQRTFQPVTVKQKLSSKSTRPYSTTAPLYLQTSKPQNLTSRAPSELPFRRNDLRPYEAKVVFGPKSPPIALANNLLKVLHSRRVNGTLDLDLPKKLSSQLKPYPHAVEDGLHWLRLNYPLDEDAAILRRIEREEAGQGDEALIQRAENIGLYKPQSGVYGAKLGEDGDIFGESQLQKLREANDLKAEEEQKELDGFIEQKQKAYEEKVGSLSVKKEDGLEGMFCRYAFTSLH
jgi:hypothetical protein